MINDLKMVGIPTKICVVEKRSSIEDGVLELLVEADELYEVRTEIFDSSNYITLKGKILLLSEVLRSKLNRKHNTSIAITYTKGGDF